MKDAIEAEIMTMETLSINLATKISTLHLYYFYQALRIAKQTFMSKGLGSGLMLVRCGVRGVTTG